MPDYACVAELRDGFAVAHDLGVLAVMFDRVEELGKVPGCFRG
jgi:hypothetical protein